MICASLTVSRALDPCDTAPTRALARAERSYLDSFLLDDLQERIGAERSSLNLISGRHDSRNDSISLESDFEHHFVNPFS